MSKPKRIQRKRTKGSKVPEGTIDCTRNGKRGNPFKFNGDSISYRFPNPPVSWYKWSHLGFVEPSHGQAVACELFRLWAYGEILLPGMEKPPDFTALRDENLSCFCALDAPCHVDIILQIANSEG